MNMTDGELPLSSPSTWIKATPEQVLEDSGFAPNPRLFWPGGESQALTQIGRWIQDEADDLEDETSRTGISEYYTSNPPVTTMTDKLLRQIKKTITKRVLVSCYALAVAKQPDKESYKDLWRKYIQEAKQATYDLINHTDDTEVHVGTQYIPDRAPRAIGPTYTGSESARAVDDGKDQDLWEPTSDDTTEGF